MHTVSWSPQQSPRFNNDIFIAIVTTEANVYLRIGTRTWKTGSEANRFVLAVYENTIDLHKREDRNGEKSG